MKTLALLALLIAACGGTKPTPALTNTNTATTEPPADTCCCTLTDGTDLGYVYVRECTDKQGTCGADVSDCVGITGDEPVP